MVAFAEQYSTSPKKQEQAVSRYTDEYFVEKCLLLVTVETPSTGTEVLLEGLYAVEDQIYLDLAYWGIHNGGLAVEERTY